ncbi:hypothetical protein IKF89_00765 [Candidatus Saccharibacteria bacterium]|nr:hypothetical protein [Candidatus Saccharibacteria bacterium]
MPNTFYYRDYWGTVVNALSCIYLYQAASDDESEYQIRYKIFPDAVHCARIAYYKCDAFPRAYFGLFGDEADEFFSNMLADGQHLDNCYSKAIDNYCDDPEPIPMRLL